MVSRYFPFELERSGGDGLKPRARAIRAGAQLGVIGISDASAAR